jgi:flagellar biosynthesis/type III secretory pathway protein FliH
VEGGLLREQLAKQFAETQVDLQRSVADECERILQRIESELDAVVNQVMREAIKIKARQMGEIREIHEDATTGELTIKLEV